MCMLELAPSLGLCAPNAVMGPLYYSQYLKKTVETLRSRRLMTAPHLAMSCQDIVRYCSRHIPG